MEAQQFDSTGIMLIVLLGTIGIISIIAIVDGIRTIIKNEI